MDSKRRKVLRKCTIVHATISVQALALIEILCARHVEKSKRKSIAAKTRMPKQRTTWKAFVETLSDRHFCRMFRMDKECFVLLCSDIEHAVGSEKFCSEFFLENEQKKTNIFSAHSATSGGFIPGEIKLAITLHVLAGGSYLDIASIFSVSITYVHTICSNVLQQWICQDEIWNFDFLEVLEDEKKMYNISRCFAMGQSGGILAGVIGALDGWLVRIHCPNKTKDNVNNPGTYYSRKGFYALNVQVIADKNRFILWRSIGARGSEHDSAAFKSTKLYSKLCEMSKSGKSEMQSNKHNMQFYIIGDSAYALRDFLLTPYDNASPNSSEDVFNYHL